MYFLMPACSLFSLLFYCFAFGISSKCVCLLVCVCASVCAILYCIVCDAKHHIDLYCLFFHCKHFFLWIHMNSRKKHLYLSLYTCLRLSRFNCWVYCFGFLLFSCCFFSRAFFVFFVSLLLWIWSFILADRVCETVCMCAERVRCVQMQIFLFRYFSHKCLYPCVVVFIIRHCVYCVDMNKRYSKAARAKRSRNNALVSQTISLSHKYKLQLNQPHFNGGVSVSAAMLKIRTHNKQYKLIICREITAICGLTISEHIRKYDGIANLQ